MLSHRIIACFQALGVVCGSLFGATACSGPVDVYDEAAELSMTVVDSVVVADELMGFLLIEEDRIGFGDTLTVRMVLENRRSEPRVILGSSIPYWSIHTLLNGEYVVFRGGLNAGLPSETEDMIPGCGSKGTTWTLRPEGDEAPGRYDVRVGLGVVEVDGRPVERPALRTEFELVVP